jgi:YidC/Oxa1 family membrane protein insertase
MVGDEWGMAALSVPQWQATPIAPDSDRLCMDFFGTLLFPLKWIIEAVLTGAHTALTDLGLAPDGGLVWLLAIFALVLVIRTAILPLTIRQQRSQQRMGILAPKLNAVRERYKPHLEDPQARADLQREIAEIYKDAQVHPLAPYAPILVQVIVFISLFQVLIAANAGRAGIGLMNAYVSASFSRANLFDLIPLRYTMIDNHGNLLVVVVGLAILALMTLLQTATQYMILTATVESGKLGDVHVAQRAVLYAGPVLSIISTFAFPVVILSYWLFSNLYTLVQQYILLRTIPLPRTPNGMPGTAREAVAEIEDEG